jgi:hypothetical protein
MPKKPPSQSSPEFTNLSKNIAVAKQSSTVITLFLNNIQEQARQLELSVETRKQELQSKVDAYLHNPDNRPTFKSSIAKKVWTIAFNDQIYRFGPRFDLDKLDEDEPAYFWEHPESTMGTTATSSTAALLACLQHYCARPE